MAMVLATSLPLSFAAGFPILALRDGTILKNKMCNKMFLDKTSDEVITVTANF